MAEPAIAAKDTETVDYGVLTNSLGFLLRLSQLVSFEDYFEVMGGVGVRPGEISALMLIAGNPGIRQGVLARHLMIKRAHMTKMVRAMEDDGLVTRTVPADDKRSVELWLSAKGKDHVAALTVPFLKHESRTAHGLTAREEADLKRLLRKFLDLPAPDKGAGG